MFDDKLTLISHHLCPYVQRSVITLTEKEIDHNRIYIDLSSKPSWFLSISPTGKVPVLFINQRDILFESAVICEYLDEVTPGSLHPLDPLEKARHRAWIEFGSLFLNDISALYNAQSEALFDTLVDKIQMRIERLETVVEGRFFAGDSFSLVDAAYGPVFRYFDVLDEYLPRSVFVHCGRVAAWRRNLAARESVRNAVSGDYAGRLTTFLLQRRSYLGAIMGTVNQSISRGVS
ncbi:MAG: glutathione S-transferase family protein [Aquisalimonadaceae bacterium]